VCPVFGHGCDLPINCLPTYEDIMLCYVWKSRSKPKQYRNLVSDVCEEVAEKVMKQWELASIPIIDHRKIVKKIKAYHDKYRNLLKPYASRKNVKSYCDKIKLFRENGKSLFDIATCKCESFDSCNCETLRKIPIAERIFLLDQRTDRKMTIGNIDVKSSKKNIDRINRKRKWELFQEKNTMSVPSISTCPPVRKEHCSNETYQETEPSTSQTNSGLEEYSVVAKTLDRYHISDRAGAAIVSATLQDIGLVSESDLSKVVDRSKIRRARQKARALLTNTTLVDIESNQIGLYFDGRKDKTLFMEDSRRKVILEEHISLIKEPGSEYMGHLSLSSGKALIISKEMQNFLTRNNIDNRKIVVIGSDGTAVNTGVKGGVIRILETKFEKPLQWFICQLHANELILRHIFEHLDGTTSGPQSFTGPVGKSLKDCEHLPVVFFKKMCCTLPKITNKKDLSTDQLYLLEICEAINSGSCSEGLSKRNPGKIVHSRWLTVGNRILRLYISSNAPSENLVILASFIIKVYAPMWFSIKTKPLCIFGAKHLHKTIMLSRYLPNSLKAVIDPVIQRNGFFGHPENILIAMLADDRQDINVLALRRILKARQAFKKPSRNIIRTFEIPQFNFEATDYIDIINWADVTVTEPPLTKQLDDQVISGCIMNPQTTNNIIVSNIKQFPCHTQATERCVKLVTEASASVCGPSRRDGFIKTCLESRKQMPVFNTKKQYRPV